MPASVLRLVRSAIVALCTLTADLAAQSATGKLVGRVQDEAGTPLVEAQVYLVGSAFSATSDASGRYFINNLPAGTWAVRAIFLGYRPVEVEGLRVPADQTVTLDFSLTAALIELQEIIVVAAENLLVPRDEVTTKQRIDGQFADALPIDRLEQVLALQPGVIQANESNLSGGGKDAQGGLSVRGGRPTQNAIYIDGVPVQAGYKGDRMFGYMELGSRGSSLDVGTNAIEEASVTTGSPSAAFGNATSGLISIVTRTGGPRYHGSFGFESDEPFGVNNGTGFNRFQAGISGPVQGRLTFAFSGVLEGQQSVEEGLGSRNVPIFLSAGVDTAVRQVSILEDDTTTAFDERLTADTTVVDVYRYAISRGDCDQFADAGEAGLRLGRDVVPIEGIRSNYGFPCGGVRVPATPRTLFSLSGKLNYTYGTGSRVTLSLGQSRFQGHRFDFIIPHVGRLSARVGRGFSDRSRLATLTWVHNLARSAERALALDLSVSYQQDRTTDGPLTNRSWTSTRAPWGGFILEPLGFVYDFDNFPVDEALIARVRRHEPRMVPRPHDVRFPDKVDHGAFEMEDLLRNNAYGLYGRYQGFRATGRGVLWFFPETVGLAGNLPVSLYRENRYIGKAGLDWQADRYNRVKVGGEVTRYEIAHYTTFLWADEPHNTYLERPLRWNGYLEDRLDLGDMVLVGGLRFDWYRTGASRPYATDTLGRSYHLPRIYSLPGFDPADPTAHFIEDRAHGYLSPRLQVSFPVTDRTNFRFSYAHQVQAPDLGLILSGINRDMEFPYWGGEYGSDIDFGKTIAFEFGIRHAFSDDMVLDVAAYNKNIIADPAYRRVTLYDPVSGRDEAITHLTNLDFGTVRGLDVRLDRRFGRWFNGTVAYAYQQARSTGSDPFTYIFYGSFIADPSTGQVQPPPQAILPTNDSRPHALTAAFSLTVPRDGTRGGTLGAVLSGVSVLTTIRYTSGSAYSRCSDRIDDLSVLSSENCWREFPEGINTQRLPAYREVNARFTKSFGIGGLDLTGYVDVRNLLNFRNVLQVFATNGGIRNDAEREANLKADLQDLSTEGSFNGVLDGDGSLHLDFPHERCSSWSAGIDFRSATANCIYLIRSEQRYGNGDGIYTVAEQTAAINALYDVIRGEHQFLGPARRARVGVEISF